MSVQLIWKRLITKQSPGSTPISLHRPLMIDAKPHTQICKFCTETATPSRNPPDRAVVTDFLIKKCGLTEKDVSKVFRSRYSQGLLYKSSHNLEEGLALLNECGLTTLAQIRKVVSWNPRIFLYKSERGLKSRLSFLRSFMKKDEICKLVYTDSRILNRSEDKFRSAISLLQRLGFEGEALSKLVTRQPRLLSSAEEKVVESFKVLEDLGVEKRSNMFRNALRGMFGVGKEKIDLKLQCLSSLGFSENQISELSSRYPWILGLSEKNLRRNVDFLVKSVGFSLDDLIRYPSLFTSSLEKRIIPRYRVIKALQYMKVLETESISPSTYYIQNKLFMERYVDKNAESSSTLRDIYYGAKAGIVDN